jgi:folate-binding protein YgfZ
MTAPCVQIPNRAAIYVIGEDRFDFLQGLITQDIFLLKSQPLIYSCLLTSNGKFLFDFFVLEDGETLVIDCEGGARAEALLKSLKKFTLRSKVTLELQDDLEVYQIFNADSDNGFKDPRHDDAGYRFYNLPSLQGLSLQSMDHKHKACDDETWDTHRIRLCIPDGARDMIPEKSFLHESDIIAKTAVSYTKGCYMGQELVSRMHHRGLIKKQLRCVDLKTIPDGAELKSSCGGIGLALVKLDL